MINTHLRPTRLTWVLLGIVAIEIGLVASLRKLGWFGTGDLLQMVVSIFVFALPLLTIGFVCLLNRFRLSLRLILAAVALLSLFMALSVKPLLDYREMRMGSFLLLNADANLYTESHVFHRWGKRMNHGSPSRTIEEPQVWIPPWVVVFVRDFQQKPADVMVTELWVDSDEQLRILTAEASRFPNLNSIILQFDSGALTSEGIKELPTIFEQSESIHGLGIYYGDCSAMAGGILTNCDGLTRISFAAIKLDTRMPLFRELSSSKLESIDFSRGCLNDAVLNSFTPPPTLKKISLFYPDVSREAVQKFRQANPQCEVVTLDWSPR